MVGNQNGGIDRPLDVGDERPGGIARQPGQHKRGKVRALQFQKPQDTHGVLFHGAEGAGVIAGGRRILCTTDFGLYVRTHW